jgi:hypothetical protein
MGPARYVDRLARDKADTSRPYSRLLPLRVYSDRNGEKGFGRYRPGSNIVSSALNGLTATPPGKNIVADISTALSRRGVRYAYTVTPWSAPAFALGV